MLCTEANSMYDMICTYRNTDKVVAHILYYWLGFATDIRTRIGLMWPWSKVHYYRTFDLAAHQPGSTAGSSSL